MTSGGIVDFFLKWIGWGWGTALLIWILGSVVILTTVQRYFLELFFQHGLSYDRILPADRLGDRFELADRDADVFGA